MNASEREADTLDAVARDADVRVGADIGGTFTDVVLRRGEDSRSIKILTDHAAPERAILDGIRELADRTGIAPASISQLVHGTTLVTNALIERRGARVAFTTTRGFRDVIEMRSENRFEQYDLNLSLPEPLVPREDRFVIGERVAADGEVLLEIDEDELDALAGRIAAGGFGAVAIGLLHAYANGAHERRVAEAVQRCAPALFVSCSCVVSPRMRELERFNTVIANAYVQPRVADYLARLRECLERAGIGATVYLMQSGGGLIALDTAIEQPVRLLESGPAGGAVFAARRADAHALNRVLSFDMGGTTAKICLIEDARPSTSSTFEVARSYRFRKGSGMTVSTPVVDMVEIGITELVDENMANAARVHAVESGHDIERFTMVAFGGGAPLHACRLCEKLGIDTLLIPLGAGVGSALGFLDAPVSCEAGRGLFQRLAAFDTTAVNALLEELEDEARRFVAAGVASPDTPVRASLTAFMRYAGQGWEIPVTLPLNMNRTDEIDLQVMWNRLIAVVEEQATTLIRTAFSTSVREAGDLSAGLFDRRGRMMAQAVTGTPGHVNAMAESVGHFVQAIGAEHILAGDVYITNDPWLGTGHLHDVTVVTPVFRKAVHIGFFACTAHVVDIGGRGFGPDGNDVYEEGLQIPIMKLVDRGELSAVLMQIVRANVREPDQVVGDIHSLIACNAAGERRLADMLEEFGIEALEALSDFIIDTSLAATRRRIAALPPGAYANTMRVDGFGTPVTMQVLLSVEGDRLHADFTGTSGQSGRGVDVPMVYTRAYACYGLKCAIAPDVPNNAGSLAPFEITAPEGCILNARRPAPVSVRHVLGHPVPDVVLGALHLCLPDTVPAEGASALWNIQIATRPVEAAGEGAAGQPGREMLMFNSGGTGARPTLDGLSAAAFPSGVSTMSVEATEQVGPIVVWRKELREGSGGAGRQRGGLGQVIEIEPRAGHEFHFNAMFDRVDHPARGRDGGGDGAPGRVALADGTPLAAKGRQKVSAGQRLVLELPGGGGYGPPSARAPEAVQRDLRAGYTLREHLDGEADGIAPLGDNS